MNETLLRSLKALFDTRRVVFWYDPDGTFRDECEAMALEGVTKVVLAKNAFALKCRLLLDEPTAKFLVYSPTKRPEPSDDWLYDLERAGAVFNTDEVSLLASDLGLGTEFTSVLSATLPFFRKAARRTADLKAAIAPGETPQSLQLKMLGVCCGVHPAATVDGIVKVLLKETADDGDTHIQLIRRCGLASALWHHMALAYGYASADPGIWDFALKMFHDAYFPALDPGARCELQASAQAFLNDWKNDTRFCEAYDELSQRAFGILNVMDDLDGRTLAEFRGLDAFAQIDEKVIGLLIADVTAGARTLDDVRPVVAERQNGHFFKKYEDYYVALESAAEMTAELNLARFDCADVPDAVAKYAANWYRIDRAYRLFTESACRTLRSGAMLGELKRKIDGLYSNTYLLNQSVAFQAKLDGVTQWDFAGVKMQRNFWRDTGAAMQERKTCIVISDALRYEIGTELVEELNRTNRLVASVEPMVAAIPAYTQLGMAALLPKETLAFHKGPDGKHGGKVFADWQPTSSKEDRKTFFDRATEGRALVMSVEDILRGVDAEAFRTAIRDCKIMIVYHNTIDATGDRRETEREVFEAARRAIGELVRTVRRIEGERYVTNFIITADHGFLYQDEPVAEGDFIADADCEAAADFKSRRCLIGERMPVSTKLMNFTSGQLGLEPGVDVRIAKGVSRMRLQGSGARFTHYGASLQEIVVPCITVASRRNARGAVQPVAASIIAGGAARITTGQLTVQVYQEAPVADRVTERNVRLALFAADGTQISDAKDLCLNSPSAVAADRTFPVTLTLNHAADGLRGVTVTLKMLNRVERGTVQYEPYQTRTYTLQRQMTLDF